MNAQAWLSVGRDSPRTHSVAGDIDLMRDKLLNDALLWIAAVSVPALSLSISRMVTLGWRPLFLGQVAMVVMIWGIWLLRHRLPYALRISALLVTLAVVGISGYMQLGILAQSGQFLLLFMFLTALFLNGAAALRVGAVIAAVLVVVAWGVVDGVLETHIDYSTFGQDPRNWLLAIYVVIFYGGAVAFLGWRMRQELVERQLALEKANDELSQRAREIEAANRIKGEILSNLSHEFRTPLNGILGMTDILRDGEEDAERLDWLAQLHESAESLQAMLNRMIDFASMESEGVRLRHSEFALREIVEVPLRKARALAAQKGLAVSVSCPRPWSPTAGAYSNCWVNCWATRSALPSVDRSRSMCPSHRSPSSPTASGSGLSSRIPGAESPRKRSKGYSRPFTKPMGVLLVPSVETASGWPSAGALPNCSGAASGWSAVQPAACLP